MYPFTLTGGKSGINRMRVKAGARQDTLYDLTNAYLNAARDFVPRGGTVIAHTLPAGTVGLCVFQEKRHVFSSEPVTMTDPKYINHVLLHPTGSDLVWIHFAEPLMGFLFVSAEYADGSVYLYWLTEGPEGGDAWAPNTIYMLGQVIRPTIPNGLYYSANRRYPAAPKWKPNVLRAVNDVVEPTVFNGYEAVCIGTFGANPRSGAVEPKWPAEENAVIFEDTDAVPDDGDDDDDDGPQLPPGVPPRYPPGSGYPAGGGANPPQQQQ